MLIYLAGERAAMATTAAIRRLGGEGAAAVWTRSVKRRLFSFYYHGYSGSNYEKTATGLSSAIADSLDFGWDLFLDSGAFTAFTKGIVIDEAYLAEYARYIKRCLPRKIFTVYSSLDAIGTGAQAAIESRANYLELRKRGMPVRPVFHIREPPEYLAQYIDEGCEYIFIGGMVPESTRDLMQLLDGLWSKYLTNKDGTPKVKIHGFGLTDSKLMFRYPWYSVDSSSWLMTGIFGACLFRIGGKMEKIVFSEESPEARKFKGRHYHRMPLMAQRQIDEWIEPYGITAQQLSEHYSFRDVVNAAVFQGLEDLGAKKFVNIQPTLTDYASNWFDLEAA